MIYCNALTLSIDSLHSSSRLSDPQVGSREQAPFPYFSVNILKTCEVKEINFSHLLHKITTLNFKPTAAAVGLFPPCGWRTRRIRLNTLCRDSKIGITCAWLRSSKWVVSSLRRYFQTTNKQFPCLRYTARTLSLAIVTTTIKCFGVMIGLQVARSCCQVCPSYQQ